MPRASRVTTHKSKYHPDTLELLTVDGEPLPEHFKKFHHDLLLTLSYLAWRVYRARKRTSKAKEQAETLRDEFLNTFTGILRGLYGFRVYRKRSLEVLVVEPHSDKIIDPAGVIAHLGPHASEIVKGIELPIEELMSDPANYARFVKAVQKEFGDELASGVTITIHRDALHKLVKDGELEELPPSVFERTTGNPRLNIKLLDPKPGLAGHRSRQRRGGGGFAI